MKFNHPFNIIGVINKDKSEDYEWMKQNQFKPL